LENRATTNNPEEEGSDSDELGKQAVMGTDIITSIRLGAADREKN